METCHHHEMAALNPEEDSVRKPPEQCAAHVAMENRKTLRLLGDRFERSVQGLKELLAQAWSSSLIP